VSGALLRTVRLPLKAKTRAEEWENMAEIIVTENQTIVTLNNIAASYETSFICEILEKAADAGVSIDMIAQSTATSDKIGFAFTLDDDALPKLLPVIKSPSIPDRQLFITCGNVKIAVKSQDMVNGAGFASKVFQALKKQDCLPLLITTGIDEISLLIPASNQADLEKNLHQYFTLN
jgi:aspartokinase